MPLLLVLALAPAVASADESDDGAPRAPALRLRIEWGRGLARKWQGTLALSEGVLSNPSPLGIEADEPGSMWIEEGRLSVSQPSARPYDGVDVDVDAPLEASLIVALSPADNPISGTPREIPLAQLIHRRFDGQLDDRKNVLRVLRAPGDKLRVTLDRDALIYQSDEPLEIEVTPTCLAEAAGARLRLQARLTNALDKSDAGVLEKECQLDEHGSSPPVAFSLPLPKQEGVYDLDLQPTRHRFGLWSPVSGGRRIQFVVLSPGPHLPQGGSEPPAETVVEIDPANPTWWQRLPSIPMLPSLRRPLGSGDAAVWQHSLGNLVQIGARNAAGWEAYPLPIDRPGEPHIVEIQYPNDVPQVLGVSIVEPNDTAVVTPTGLDSGVYLPDDGAEVEPKMNLHRLVFWPRTKTPLLRLDGSKAVYGKIRVLGPRRPGMAAVFDRDDWQSHSSLPRRFPAGDQPNGRLLAGYYDRPLFAANFSANQAVDPIHKYRLDDWRTFYEGGSRLVEYLNYVGYNGLMLTVLADGSAIYPSELLSPTPRYDTGAYFTTGQDVYRKDVLELLFRLFDREGLTLVPALDFSAPLPALENLRRDGPGGGGIELVGRDGQPWLKHHPPRQHIGPYYNPLNEQVQTAMMEVARELAHRYRHHPSFGGLALQLTADGYAQLPGDDCGYDDETLAAFEAASGERLPPADGGLAGRVAWIEKKARTPWLQWRAAEMTAFYSRMQTQIAAERPGLKLYLAGTGLFDRPEMAHKLRPVLSRVTTKNEEALLSVGIDPQGQAKRDDVVIMRPQWVAPLQSLAAQAVNLELNFDQQLDRLFAEQPVTAALFYHEPRESRLKSFDAKNPFKGVPSRHLAQVVPSAQHTRRRFVHAVATLDARAMFDGGRLLPLGQEHELGPLVAAYRGLPNLPFATVEGHCQPVTVRSLSHDGRTYVYFANDSPWKVDVSLTVEKAAECTVRSLYPGRRATIPSGDGYKQNWLVPLEPYDLLAVAFSTENVKLSGAEVRLDRTIVAQLDARIQDLTERARVLKEPLPLDAPANGDFERPAVRGGISGWESAPAGALARLVPAQQGEVVLDNQEPYAGQQCVKLSARGGKVTLASAAFPAPATGWLSVSVWMRAKHAGPPPKLTLALEGTVSGNVYRRQESIPDARNAVRLGDEWKMYSFVFDNLPTVDISPLRLRFTCDGNGEVWLDDVRTFDLEKREGNDLVTLVWLAIQRAGAKLEKKEYADCWQLLDGYWPRYLRTYVPLTQEPIANHPRPRRAAPAAPPPKTGLYERVKDSLRWWR
ncbi:MAG TPA: family 10 glycosylhydrolase [Pirellulales bacterium]|nr:family 10 glycosylhydrolase [Pirellulales bacterium]